MYDYAHILRQFRNRTMYCSLSLVCQDNLLQSLFILNTFCFGQFDKTQYLAVLYVIESTAPTEHKDIGFECDFEVVPMTMYYQIRKGVDSNIFGCVDVMHITVNEENKTTEQLLHYFVKGTFITIEETAVATCAVIHVSSS